MNASCSKPWYVHPYSTIPIQCWIDQEPTATTPIQPTTFGPFNSYGSAIAYTEKQAYALVPNPVTTPPATFKALSALTKSRLSVIERMKRYQRISATIKSRYHVSDYIGHLVYGNTVLIYLTDNEDEVIETTLSELGISF